MSKYQQTFPEDNPDHPDHDAAVARAWAGHDKRHHDDLRAMVDQACERVSDHTTGLIKDAARRAYYLGARDGIQIEREKK